ncbi:hypothetical protein TNCV_165621 [Trichonephila clavipes]|nr:hypothetical protein TNCV_165621 [Trichonephila clavipes]
MHHKIRDNACPHIANIIKKLLAKKKVELIEHLPYSPDLNPPDFSLFPRLELGEHSTSRSRLYTSQQSLRRHGNVCGRPTRCLSRASSLLCRSGRFLGHWMAVASPSTLRLDHLIKKFNDQRDIHLNQHEQEVPRKVS